MWCWIRLKSNLSRLMVLVMDLIYLPELGCRRAICCVVTSIAMFLLICLQSLIDWKYWLALLALLWNPATILGPKLMFVKRIKFWSNQSQAIKNTCCCCYLRWMSVEFCSLYYVHSRCGVSEDWCSQNQVIKFRGDLNEKLGSTRCLSDAGSSKDWIIFVVHLVFITVVWFAHLLITDCYNPLMVKGKWWKKEKERKEEIRRKKLRTQCAVVM